jgi:hypothetical protein
MKLYRFRSSEFNFERFTGAISRRLVEIPHTILWNVDPAAFANRRRLSNFYMKHSGQRCIIIGNGPSLSTMDLSPLKNEVTFGLNRIYLLFNKLPFIPTFYVCINELVLDQFAEDIRKLPMPKFLNWNQKSLFDVNNDDTYFVKLSYRLKDRFGISPQRPLSGGGTVTFIAIQLAYFMGFQEVILIGLDHNFSEKGIPNTTEVRQSERDMSHFDPNYFPKGVKWQLPDLLHSEYAYSLARKAFEKDSRRIVDATVGGKCPVFDKVDFATIFHHSD